MIVLSTMTQQVPRRIRLPTSPQRSQTRLVKTPALSRLVLSPLGERPGKGRSVLQCASAVIVDRGGITGSADPAVRPGNAEVDGEGTATIAKRVSSVMAGSLAAARTGVAAFLAARMRPGEVLNPRLSLYRSGIDGVTRDVPLVQIDRRSDLSMDDYVATFITGELAPRGDIVR